MVSASEALMLTVPLAPALISEMPFALLVSDSAINMLLATRAIVWPSLVTTVAPGRIFNPPATPACWAVPAVREMLALPTEISSADVVTFETSRSPCSISMLMSPFVVVTPRTPETLPMVSESLTLMSEFESGWKRKMPAPSAFASAARVSASISRAELELPMPSSEVREIEPAVISTVVSVVDSIIVPLAVRLTVPLLLAVMEVTEILPPASRVMSLLATTSVAVITPVAAISMSPLLVSTSVSVRSPLLLMKMPPLPVTLASSEESWVSRSPLAETLSPMPVPAVRVRAVLAVMLVSVSSSSSSIEPPVVRETVVAPKSIAPTMILPALPEPIFTELAVMELNSACERSKSCATVVLSPIVPPFESSVTVPVPASILPLDRIRSPASMEISPLAVVSEALALLRNTSPLASTEI